MDFIIAKQTAMATCIEHKGIVVGLQSSDYTTSQFKAFKKSILQVLRYCDHVHLVLVEAEYRQYMNDAGVVIPTPTDPGTSPNFTGLTDLGQIEHSKAIFNANKIAYYAQEGVSDAIKNIISKNVPESILSVLQDEEHGFANVTALEMMTAIGDVATDNEAFSVAEMLQQYRTMPDLEANEPLGNYFHKAEKLAKKLSSETPNPVPNHGALQVELLAHIKAHGGYKDDVDVWEVKPSANRTWDEFKSFFKESDKKRRLLLKFGVSSQSSPFGANNVTDDEIDVKISTQVAAGLAQITKAVESSLDIALATVPTSTSNRITSSTAAATKRIEELTQEVEKLKKENGRNSRSRESQRKMDKKCPHCNRWHPYIAEEKCYGHPNFSGEVPSGWKKADP
mmetsp:Transcript_11217/g.19107  ORF Transcript_11217/g.19107 Transcript_11217/m.19107 type:complete len:395 (-) Transcript_11217:116-1300(-)